MSTPAAVAVLAGALAFAFAASAGAQKLYRWVDKDGKVHYSDHVPPAAVEQARDELNEQGMRVGSVERAMTPQELTARDALRRQEAEDAARAAEEAKRDLVLMTSYEDESALERAFRERFDLLEQTLTTARLGMQSQEKSLADLLAHGANLERAGKPVPDGILQSINRARSQVQEQRSYMERREAEKAALQVEYEQTLARYRALRAKNETARGSG